ncbi:MAG: hypothetical protein ACOX4P_05555 [Anaerovoracaceae bacterium]
MKELNSKTKTIALGGVLLALSLVTIFLASFIPGFELTLYALSTFCVVIFIIETKAKGGWLFYGASCLLSLVLIPNKLALLPYIIFFGLYGLIKYYIERIRKQPVEIILKLLFFNGSWGIGLYFFKNLLISNIGLPDYPVIVLIIAAQILFLLYDYILTQLIGFYRNRFYSF